MCSALTIGYPVLSSASLHEALGFGGGSGVEGGARILLRAAVAALLNASHGGVGFPWTVGQVIAEVNSALASGDRDKMLVLASALDTANNLGCPLHGSRSRADTRPPRAEARGSSRLTPGRVARRPRGAVDPNQSCELSGERFYLSIEEVVSTTSDPAFAVDLRGVIVAWNEAAERVLGYPADSVLHHYCWELLKGQDAFGNDYCSADCPLRKMALRGKPLHRSHLQLMTSSGDRKLFEISLLSIPGTRHAEDHLVHVLCPLPTDGSEPDLDAGAEVTWPKNELTPRELEVLHLLGEGVSTREIADRLFISIRTVRNHVQNILYKLECHSRLSAVARARGRGLL